MSDPARFSAEEVEQLRRRFVIDRVDGRPLLVGHAACPRCSASLKLKPVGNMELSESNVRIRFFVACPDCDTELVLEDNFGWGS